MIKNAIKTASFISLLTLTVAIQAADIDTNANTNDLAIGGYDTVAYFTEGTAKKGTANHTATFKNAIYYFSSSENRDLFKSNPAKYAPQFGGFCAYGVTKGRKFDTDPTAWRVVDGKLYLNLNHDVQQVWVKDIPGNITSAIDTWPTIKSFSDAALESF